MLMETNEAGTRPVATALPDGLQVAGKPVGGEITTGAEQSKLAKVLRVEWIGQTAASLCWIASVLAYGISSTGDWLQLGAASAWLVANIAAAASSEAD